MASATRANWCGEDRSPPSSSTSRSTSRSMMASRSAAYFAAKLGNPPYMSPSIGDRSSSHVGRVGALGDLTPVHGQALLARARRRRRPGRPRRSPGPRTRTGPSTSPTPAGRPRRPRRPRGAGRARWRARSPIIPSESSARMITFTRCPAARCSTTTSSADGSAATSSPSASTTGAASRAHARRPPVVEVAAGAQTVVDRSRQHGDPLALVGGRQSDRPHHVVVRLRGVRQQPPRHLLVETIDHDPRSAHHRQLAVRPPGRR